VYPTEQIPYWVISNYFYREMSTWLRLADFAFLLLFGLTTFVLAGAGLEWLGITRTIFSFTTACLPPWATWEPGADRAYHQSIVYLSLASFSCR